MKITGGRYKSVTVFSVKDRRTRYTTSKIRLAIFSILGDRIKNSNILELFCGSGILSIEAISRGAKRAVLVDISSEAISTVRKNMKKLDFLNYRALKMDYRRALKYLKGKEKFDFIFADPPYDLGYGEELLVNIEKNNEILNENSKIVLEISKRESLIIPNSLTVETDKNLGDSKIIILRFEGGLSIEL